jgi:hypothetical protein
MVALVGTSTLVYNSSYPGPSGAQSQNYTCPDVGDNALIVVFSFQYAVTVSDVSGVEYNGVAMTFLGEAVEGANSRTRLSVWGLSNPSTGSSYAIDYNVDNSRTRSRSVIAIPISGAHQTTSSLAGTIGTGTGVTGNNSMQATVTSVVSGSVVIGGCNTYGADTDPISAVLGTELLEWVTGTSTSHDHSGSVGYFASGVSGSVTYEADADGVDDTWCAFSLEIFAAGGGGGGGGTTIPIFHRHYQSMRKA